MCVSEINACFMGPQSSDRTLREHKTAQMSSQPVLMGIPE